MQISTSLNGVSPGNKITVHGLSFKNIKCGGAGDCFFIFISKGLADCDIVWTYKYLLKMLWDWLEDKDNANKFELYIGVTSVKNISYLRHLAIHCPSNRGWHYLFKIWTRKYWGSYIKVPRRWAGGLDVSLRIITCLLYPSFSPFL